ncbi:MAG: hypothetical protein A2V87_10885 [Deltaproteobacteria bacterium RBG_16_58_17]|nr:MAG: hypothetical protein A2V87_10885 [Deltaproteobacteria bacterium RBG_16_58_17]
MMFAGTHPSLQWSEFQNLSIRAMSGGPYLNLIASIDSLGQREFYIEFETMKHTITERTLTGILPRVSILV